MYMNLSRVELDQYQFLHSYQFHIIRIHNQYSTSRKGNQIVHKIYLKQTA